MNTDRILQLVSIYEQPVTKLPDGTEVRLDMGKFGRRTECGTVACIAGTAVLLWDKSHWWAEVDPGVEILDAAAAEPGPASGIEAAIDILDLTWEQATRLFWPPDFDTRPRTREEAAAVLRRLAETGVAEWEVL